MIDESKAGALICSNVVLTNKEQMDPKSKTNTGFPHWNFNIDSKIKVKTKFGDEITGRVFTYDTQTHFLVLRIQNSKIFPNTKLDFGNIFFFLENQSHLMK